MADGFPMPIRRNPQEPEGLLVPDTDSSELTDSCEYTETDLIGTDPTSRADSPVGSSDTESIPSYRRSRSPSSEPDYSIREFVLRATTDELELALLDYDFRMDLIHSPAAMGVLVQRGYNLQVEETTDNLLSFHGAFLAAGATEDQLLDVAGHNKDIVVDALFELSNHKEISVRADFQGLLRIIEDHPNALNAAIHLVGILQTAHVVTDQ